MTSLALRCVFLRSFSYFYTRSPCLLDDAAFYHFTVGSWRWYSLNSEIRSDTGSQQYKWLRSELAADSSRCIGAYWHEPLLNAGQWGTAERMRPIWTLLAAAGSTVVLVGHEHNYQRWVALDGITQFVVGTGGGGFHELPTAPSDSRLAMQSTLTLGVLQLALESDHADFRFLTTRNDVLDDGTISCGPAP
jgi:hypothetical protein